MNFKAMLIIFGLFASANSIANDAMMKDVCEIADKAVRKGLAKDKDKGEVVSDQDVIDFFKNKKLEECITMLYPADKKKKQVKLVKANYRMVDGIEVLIDPNETADTRGFIRIVGPKRDGEQVTPKRSYGSGRGVQIRGPKGTDTKGSN